MEAKQIQQYFKNKQTSWSVRYIWELQDWFNI